MTHEEFNQLAGGKMLLETKSEPTEYIKELCEAVKGGLMHNGYFIKKIELETDRLNVYPAKDDILDDQYDIIQKYANQVREKHLCTGHTWLKVVDGHLFIQVW